MKKFWHQAQAQLIKPRRREDKEIRSWSRKRSQSPSQSLSQEQQPTQSPPQKLSLSQHDVAEPQISTNMDQTLTQPISTLPTPLPRPPQRPRRSRFIEHLDDDPDGAILAQVLSPGWDDLLALQHATFDRPQSIIPWNTSSTSLSAAPPGGPLPVPAPVRGTESPQQLPRELEPELEPPQLPSQPSEQIGRAFDPPPRLQRREHQKAPDPSLSQTRRHRQMQDRNYQRQRYYTERPPTPPPLNFSDMQIPYQSNSGSSTPPSPISATVKKFGMMWRRKTIRDSSGSQDEKQGAGTLPVPRQPHKSMDHRRDKSRTRSPYTHAHGASRSTGNSSSLSVPQQHYTSITGDSDSAKLTVPDNASSSTTLTRGKSLKRKLQHHIGSGQPAASEPTKEPRPAGFVPSMSWQGPRQVRSGSLPHTDGLGRIIGPPPVRAVPLHQAPMYPVRSRERGWGEPGPAIGSATGFGHARVRSDQAPSVRRMTSVRNKPLPAIPLSGPAQGAAGSEVPGPSGDGTGGPNDGRFKQLPPISRADAIRPV
ncbi:hypothetical protein KEM55_006509 [Ascosphaera atra]|nr:hypothetical protein KEM55_006509 [Ascosphaera atra]